MKLLIVNPSFIFPNRIAYHTEITNRLVSGMVLRKESDNLYDLKQTNEFGGHRRCGCANYKVQVFALNSAEKRGKQRDRLSV